MPSSPAPIQFHRIGGTAAPEAIGGSRWTNRNLKGQIGDSRFQLSSANSASHFVLLFRDPSSSLVRTSGVFIVTTRILSPSTSVAICAWKTTPLVSPLNRKLGKYLSSGYCFNDLQAGDCIAERLGVEASLLEPHCHVVRPADAPSRKTAPNEGQRRFQRLSP